MRFARMGGFKLERKVITLPWLLMVVSMSWAQENNAHSAERIDASLWVQTSMEWQAVCTQAWRLAEFQMEHALQQKNWSAALEQTGSFSSLPPAVIVDIDETVLDNSAFQGRLIKDRLSYTFRLWDDWVSHRKAPAIPGSLSFVRRAHELGVAVFYVSNRACAKRKGSAADCPGLTDTIANLKALGFPGVKEQQIMLRKQRPEWTGDKVSRRQLVASTHRILLLVGDDLGDFLSIGGQTLEQRSKKARDHQKWWGRRWIVLPNPMYGSWKRALGKDNLRHLRGYR